VATANTCQAAAAPRDAGLRILANDGVPAAAAEVATARLRARVCPAPGRDRLGVGNRRPCGAVPALLSRRRLWLITGAGILPAGAAGIGKYIADLRRAGAQRDR